MTLYEFILEFSGKPALVALATASAAILGIYLTNRAHAIRLELQLKQERLLKREERQKNLKRDSFLAAIGAVHYNLSLLTRLLDPDFQYATEGVVMAEKNARLTELHLTGSQEVVAAVLDAQSAIAIALSGLMVRAMQMQMHKKSADVELSLSKDYQEKISKTNALMNDHNLSGKLDDRYFNMLKGDYDFYSSESDKHMQEYRNLYKLVASEQKEVADLIVRERIAIIPPFSKLIITMRAELNFSIDAVWYQDKLMEAANADGRTATNLIDGIVSTVQEKLDSIN